MHPVVERYLMLYIFHVTV